MVRLNHESRAKTDLVIKRGQVDWSPKLHQDVIDGGRYEGLKPAELAFVAPGYFCWALAQRQFPKAVMSDAEDVYWKMRHIKPPQGRGSSRFAYTFDKKKELINLALVSGKAVSNVQKGLIINKHLDFTVASHEDSDRRTGKLMSLFLHRTFMPGSCPNHYDYQQFLVQDANFDVSCREKHCPLVPRRHGLPGF